MSVGGATVALGDSPDDLPIDVEPVRRPPRVPGAAEDASGPAAWIVGCLSGLAFLLPLLVGNLDMLRSTVHEDGDFAANSILIDKAVTGQLFVGNYSRVGFHHPGPAILDAQALGDGIFHRLLHAVPSSFVGQWLGILILNAVCIGIAATIVRQVSKRWDVAVAVPIAALAISSWEPFASASTWMPHTYIAPFLLLTVAVAAVAAARWNALWMLVFAGGLLVHGHVSFVLFVTVSSVFAIGCGWWLGRRRDSPGPRLRRDIVPALGVLAVFVAPMIANLIVDWPGPYGDYLKFSTDRTDFPDRSLGDVVQFVFRYWTGGSAWWGAAIAASAAVTVILWHRQRREFRVFVATLSGAIVLETFLLAFYGYRGVDLLGEIYVGFFAFSGPALVLALGMMSVVGATVRVLATTLARLGLVAAAVVVLASGQFTNPYRGWLNMDQVADQVEAPLVRVDFATGGWPWGVGLVEELRRRDVPVCVVNPVWDLVVTDELVCDDGPAPSDAESIFVFGPGEERFGDPVIDQDGIAVSRL